jgi:transcriptional regulator with XRE-family HTH domain
MHYGGMKPFRFTLAAAMRQMLDESGLQQADIVELAEVSKGSVTNYTKGRTVPKWTTVQRWASLCDYDPNDETLRQLWEEARVSGWVEECVPNDCTLFDYLAGLDVVTDN